MVNLISTASYSHYAQRKLNENEGFPLNCSTGFKVRLLYLNGAAAAMFEHHQLLVTLAQNSSHRWAPCGVYGGLRGPVRWVYSGRERRVETWQTLLCKGAPDGKGLVVVTTPAERAKKKIVTQN